jgi:hypothetical protein
LGAVVATGETAAAAMAACKNIAEKVEGLSIDKPVEALAKAHADLKQLLGDKADDRPKSRLERKADELSARGQLSPRARERMMERAQTHERA